MERLQRVDGLDFNHHTPSDKQVESLTWNLMSPVPNRDAFLAFEWNTEHVELEAHGSTIDGFNKPRPKLPVDHEAAADDRLNDRLGFGIERRVHAEHDAFLRDLRALRGQDRLRV